MIRSKRYSPQRPLDATRPRLRGRPPTPPSPSPSLNSVLLPHFTCPPTAYRIRGGRRRSASHNNAPTKSMCDPRDPAKTHREVFDSQPEDPTGNTARGSPVASTSGRVESESKMSRQGGPVALPEHSPAPIVQNGFKEKGVTRGAKVHVCCISSVVAAASACWLHLPLILRHRRRRRRRSARRRQNGAMRRSRLSRRVSGLTGRAAGLRSTRMFPSSE